MWQVLFASLMLHACVAAAPSLQPIQLAAVQETLQRASDLDTSAITSVTDEERFCTLNPTVELIELKKVKHAKGNMVFSANDRIQGDKLLVNNYDDESFTTAVDIEVQLKYTSASGNTLTSIEIYVDASAGDANAYLVGGGIGKNTAHILLACNQTRTFSYEAYFYGY